MVRIITHQAWDKESDMPPSETAPSEVSFHHEVSQSGVAELIGKIPAPPTEDPVMLPDEEDIGPGRPSLPSHKRNSNFDTYGRRLDKHFDSDQVNDYLEAQARLEARDAKDPCAKVLRGIMSWMVIMVIMINVICIGCEADGFMDPDVVFACDIFFSSMFVAEISIRIGLDGWKDFYRGEGYRLRVIGWELWNIFDTICVATRFLGLILSVLGLDAMPCKLVSILRMWRFRSFCFQYKHIQALRELNLILTGFIDMTKTLFWVVTLLSLIMLTLAILLTVGLGHNEDAQSAIIFETTAWESTEYFGTVAKSFYTLFQVVTRDRWAGGILKPIIFYQPLLLVPLMAFMAISFFGILNTITANVVESIMVAVRGAKESADKEMDKLQQKITASLQQMFEQADEDGDGMINIKELKLMMKTRDFRDRLNALSIPPEDLAGLHALLDGGKKGTVPIVDFFRGSSKLRGPAMAVDAHKMLVDMQHACDKCESLSEFAESTNDILEELLVHTDEFDRQVLKGGEDDFKDPVLLARRARKRNGTRAKAIRLNVRVSQLDSPGNSPTGRPRLGTPASPGFGMLGQGKGDLAEQMAGIVESRKGSKVSVTSRAERRTASKSLIGHAMDIARYERERAESKARGEIQPARGTVPKHLSRGGGEVPDDTEGRVRSETEMEAYRRPMSASKAKVNARRDNFMWGVN
eukprot:TRINITY_DN121019_c0_g1_i1.p1 TRINITY_DN121019_c0_g1~~TRINITY_DN121019_c0_g1_i1.p1  ORF type:complete len:694 (+),score=150.69 TRINITY_DN121019_c0_g1_i1:91-2172(+)